LQNEQDRFELSCGPVAQVEIAVGLINEERDQQIEDFVAEDQLVQTLKDSTQLVLIDLGAQALI
jgi:hypothetical protein